ncbi:MAG: SCP2 sterol-binding domain-containing protein [Deltaproteobacteria bacterium]|jgi:aldehyde:ferredoxin oxidoreductase|nr:SCP2 sterol-binding domain-containing protein [Deltaproteobacteria bacterium]MBW2531423.1 SCP2 sterol-binding domain-containing protein [Deltaproteobacteria bacterium]
MGLPEAYAGKLLRVDLSSGRSETFDTEAYARRFLGGRGVATAIYWAEVPPECRFDDEENRLVATFGPLSGMRSGLGGSRWGIYGKSPFPAAAHGGRDHFCYGNLGGAFGAELRFAGYDGLVVQGKADRPVWIAIEDDRVELRSAEELWGRDTVETRAALAEEARPGSKTMVIGPAGEQLVPLATVFADGDASCSGGMGAVMGAKNLKAVAVRGSQRKVAIADREALRAIDRYVRSLNRGNVKVWGLDFMAHGPRTKKLPCYGCMAHCLRVRYRADNGDSGKFMCQARFFYMHHAWGYYGEDNDVPFLANRICDRYGIDTWEVQALIEWLLLCHGAGTLSERETGLDLSKVGSLEFIEALVAMISRREGFGAELAQGAQGAAHSRGGPSAALFTRTDPYDPRYCTVNTLLFPFETREPIQQLHEAGLVLSQWSSWAKGVPEAHISSDVVRGIAERFWGSASAADMTTLDGKAEAARRIQDRQLAKESMGVCDWMFPLIDLPGVDDHVGDPSIESRILAAALGEPWAEADLYRVGERVFNLQRALLLREGHRARQDDRLPEEWHDQAIETHVADPDLLAPGPAGQIVSQLGRRAHREDFLRIRDDYYERRGWDVPTGLPSRDRLDALELSDVAEDLLERRLAVESARGISWPRRLRHAVGRLGERRRCAVRSDREADAPRGASIRGDELRTILETEREKFGHEAVRKNFAGWNKSMQYHFPDIDEHWVLRFVDGEVQPPERAREPLAKPDIHYEMNTWTLQAMSAGRLSGEKAYLTRQLRIKASFGDMLKLQSLNRR